MARNSTGQWLLTVSMIAILLMGAMAGSSSALQASGQAAQTAPAIATVEDAKPFLGSWTTTFDSPQGPATFDIEVHLDSGDPGATVSNAIIGESTVTDVTKAGAALVLRYVVDVQGTQVTVAISLVRDGETLKASFSFLDGQFTASSVATRRK
jgi:hypothetical protein